MSTRLVSDLLQVQLQCTGANAAHLLCVRSFIRHGCVVATGVYKWSGGCYLSSNLDQVTTTQPFCVCVSVIIKCCFDGRSIFVYSKICGRWLIGLST